MFTTIIVQPIFNLLVLIYALIPGHNFGLAIILFTILIRLLLYPLLRKQLHHAKAMRELAPELKRIKKQAAGDRRKESAMTMELYKQKEINPFSSLGLIIIQVPILIGLYIGLRKIIVNPDAILTFSYPSLQHLSWMKTLSGNIHQFDNSLFGVINLGRAVSGPQGFYFPAMILAAASAIMQYLQSKMLLPKATDGRGLRSIFSEASQGKQADQAEVSAAVGRSTLIFIPAIIFLVSIQLAAALPLYWFTSSFVAYIQQRRILGGDVKEAKKIALKVTTRTETAKPATAKTSEENSSKKQKRQRRKSAKRRRR